MFRYFWKFPWKVGLRLSFSFLPFGRECNGWYFSTHFGHGMTLAMEVVSSTTLVSGTGVSVQPWTFMWETSILLKLLVFRSLLLTTKGKLCYYSPEGKDRLTERDTFSNSDSLTKDPQEISRVEGWQTVSVEGQLVDSFDFEGHRVSATPVPYSAIVKAMDKMNQTWLCSSKALITKTGNGLGLVHSLLTPDIQEGATYNSLTDPCSYILKFSCRRSFFLEHPAPSSSPPSKSSWLGWWQVEDHLILYSSVPIWSLGLTYFLNA